MLARVGVQKWDCQTIPTWEIHTLRTGDVLRRLYKGFTLVQQTTPISWHRILHLQKGGEVPEYEEG